MAATAGSRGSGRPITRVFMFGGTLLRITPARRSPAMDAKAWVKVYKPVRELAADAPPGLCELIDRCLEFDPHQRPERMSEIQGALDHMADELVVSSEQRLEALEW